MQTVPQPTHHLSDDLIEGADSLAEFIYGSRKERRKVYHLAEKGELPLFRLGAKICGRKSAILQWIAEQERRATAA
jgi:hypothetical protein